MIATEPVAAPVERCTWSVDADGFTVCCVRGRLRRAVEGWTAAVQQVSQPANRERAIKQKNEAIRRLAAHACDPVPIVSEVGPRKTDMGVNDPAGSAPRHRLTLPAKGEHGDGVHVAPRPATSDAPTGIESLIDAVCSTWHAAMSASHYDHTVADEAYYAARRALRKAIADLRQENARGSR